MKRHRTRRLALALVSLTLGSCASEGVKLMPRDGPRDASADTTAGNQCPAEVPDACPTPIPSYATDIVPIFESKCNGCHTGGDGPWPLTNYEDVVHWRVQVLSELRTCTMPPLDSKPVLPDDERSTVIAWLVCGAPEN